MNTNNNKPGLITRFLKWLFALLLDEEELPGTRQETEETKENTKRKLEGRPPYVIMPRLMTEVEEQFDAVLVSCVTDRRISINRKVGLQEVLQVAPDTPNEWGWWQKINKLCMDFVVCFGQRPIGIIELDDKSHNTAKRRKRDAFLDEACDAASLPILHVKVSRKYDKNVIKAFIRDAVRHYAKDHPEMLAEQKSVRPETPA